MKILLNLLGILQYFILKYANRKDKTIKFSGTFWTNDNWPETVGILSFDLTIMLLVLKGGVVIDLNKWVPNLPDGIAFVGDLAICYIIGLTFAAGIYHLFKTKTK